MATTRTQLQKIVGFLETGKQLTVAESRRRYGVRNLRARIHELRQDGFVIYTNSRKVSGRKVTQYRLDNSQQA